MATFKDANGRSVSISNPAPSGMSRAGKGKLTEDASTEGICGSISDLDTKIQLLESRINNLKSALNALKGPISALASASCVGNHTCNVAGLLSAYSAAHIAAINAEIAALEVDLEALEYTRTLYAFMKPDNMTFK